MAEFEYGPAACLSSTSAEVAELSPLRLGPGAGAERGRRRGDGGTGRRRHGSDDVEQRVWDAVAVDGGLLEKILMADGTPEEQAKIRLPPSLLALKPEAAPDAWPSARRRLRLSFAVPAALGLVDVAEGRQGPAGGLVDGEPAPPGRARADAAGRAPPGASCRRSSRSGGADNVLC